MAFVDLLEDILSEFANASRLPAVRRDGRWVGTESGEVRMHARILADKAEEYRLNHPYRREIIASACARNRRPEVRAQRRATKRALWASMTPEQRKAERRERYMKYEKRKRAA